MDDRNLLKIQDQRHSKRWRKTAELRRRGRCLLAPRARSGLAPRIRFAKIYLEKLSSYLAVSHIVPFSRHVLISIEVYYEVRGVWIARIKSQIVIIVH